MVERNVRVAVLSFLDSLPDVSTIQPAALADRLGLSAEQVNPYLEAARQDGDNAEIVVTNDGSVQIHPRLRGQFPASSTPPTKVVSAITKAGLGGAFEVLKAAIEKVPAVKYALGVAGIAAAIAIIKTLVTDWRVAVFGVIVMLVLMVVLLIFAKLTSIAGKEIRTAMLTFMWFSLLITIASGSLLFTSVFFNWPISLKQWMTGPQASERSQAQGQPISAPIPSPNVAGAVAQPLKRTIDEEKQPIVQITIVSITVRFNLPKGDNKDDNTRLAISVRKGDIAIARNDHFAV